MGGNHSVANDANYIFTAPWTTAFNKLPSKYEALREEYTQIGYDIALYFKKYHKEPNFYAIIKAIKTAKCSPELRSKIIPYENELHEVEEILDENQGGISPWTIVAVVLIVIRIVLRLAQN